MAKDKNSFILYADLMSVVKKLPKEKAGELFIHILEYVNDLNPITEDILIEIAFEPIKLQLKRDLKKWESTSEHRSETGRIGGIKSGEARRKKAEANKAIALTLKQKEHDTVTVTVNEEKMYIYSKFYDSEIEKASNPKFEQFVKYLFGDNKLKMKLSGVLSITNQLKFSEFEKILISCEVNKKKVGDILTKMENDTKYYKGKKSLYRTLLNWTEGRFTK